MVVKPLEHQRTSKGRIVWDLQKQIFGISKEKQIACKSGGEILRGKWEQTFDDLYIKEMGKALQKKKLSLRKRMCVEESKRSSYANELTLDMSHMIKRKYLIGHEEAQH